MSFVRGSLIIVQTTIILVPYLSSQQKPAEQTVFNSSNIGGLSSVVDLK